MKHGALLRLQFLNSEDYPGMYERRVQYRRPFIQGQFHEFVPERQKPSDHDDDCVMVEVAKAMNKIQVAENDPDQVKLKRQYEHAAKKAKQTAAKERERIKIKEERDRWFESHRASMQRAIDSNFVMLSDHAHWEPKLIPLSELRNVTDAMIERGCVKIGPGRYSDPNGFQWQTCNYNGLSGSEEMFVLLNSRKIQETLESLMIGLFNMYKQHK